MKLSGWTLWWLRQDREAKKDGATKASKQKEAPTKSDQAAKTRFIDKLRKKDHPQLETKHFSTQYTPTSSMVQEMDLMCENGTADINGGTASIPNCESSNLEVGNRKNHLGYQNRRNMRQ